MPNCHYENTLLMYPTRYVGNIKYVIPVWLHIFAEKPFLSFRFLFLYDHEL